MIYVSREFCQLWNHPSVPYKYFQIDQGANIEQRSGLGYTPLHVTAHYDRVGVAKFLLECGVNPDEEDFQVILLPFYGKYLIIS